MSLAEVSQALEAADLSAVKEALEKVRQMRSDDERITKDVEELSIIRKMFAVLDKRPNDDDLHLKTFQALANLCGKPACSPVLNGNRRATIEHVALILRSMQAHIGKTAILQQACSLLWMLELEDGGNDSYVDEAIDEYTGKLGRLGCVGQILEILRRHESHAGIQAECCLVLTMMATELRSYNRENENTIVDKGGLKAVVHAMQTHPDSVTVQKAGCGVLSTFAIHHASTINQVGGTGALLAAFLKHYEQEDFALSGLISFMNCCNKDSAGTLVAGSGAIVQAMKRHSDNAQIQRFGCQSLERVAAHYADEVVEAGGLDQMIAAISSFNDNLDVVERALVPLAYLAQHSLKNRDKIGTAGGVELISSCLAQNVDNCTMADYCLRALRYIVVEHQGNGRRFCDSQGLTRLNQALKAHLSSASLQRHGLYLLSHLADCDANAIMSLDYVIAGMKHHSRLMEVQLAGSRALRMLAQADSASCSPIVVAGGLSLMEESVLDSNHHRPMVDSWLDSMRMIVVGLVGTRK